MLNKITNNSLYKLIFVIMSRVFLCNFLVSIFAIGMVIVLINFFDAQPCPMCVKQELSILVVGIVALVALIWRPKKIWIKNIFQIIIIVIIAIAVTVVIDQINLQHSTSNVSDVAKRGGMFVPSPSSCGDSQDILSALSATLSGTEKAPNCAVENVYIAGIGITYYSIVMFIWLFVYNLVILFLNNISHIKKKVSSIKEYKK